MNIASSDKIAKNKEKEKKRINMETRTMRNGLL